jgi:hypothetical protein
MAIRPFFIYKRPGGLSLDASPHPGQFAIMQLAMGLKKKESLNSVAARLRLME